MKIIRKKLRIILAGVAIVIGGSYIYQNYFFESKTEINRMVLNEFYESLNSNNIIIQRDTTNEDYAKFRLYDKESKICYYCTTKTKNINSIRYGLNKYYKIEIDFYASGNQLALPFGNSETCVVIFDKNGNVIENNNFLKDKNWNVVFGHHIDEKPKDLQSYQEFKNNLNNY